MAAKKTEPGLRQQIMEQLLTLSTAAFGLVAALAWNQVIQGFVDNYIKPYVGRDSTLIAQLIYALVVTLLAVMVTFSLTKVVKRD